MGDKEKQQWREWFADHPEWVVPIGTYLNRHSQLVATPGPHRLYWHDLTNALVPAYIKAKMAKKGE